jgi:chromosome condensin MukBEF ATPase and DNA-binding subunit MukB
MGGEPSVWQIIIGAASVVCVLGASIFGTRLGRKSQQEAHALQAANQQVTGNDLYFKQGNLLLQDVQEERNSAVEKANKLVDKVEAMDAFMRKHFAGYRAYIHELRGQIYDLGGIPKAWPPDLEQ